MNYERDYRELRAWTIVFISVCIITTIALYWGITPRQPTTYDQCDAVFDTLMRNGATDYSEYHQCLSDVRVAEWEGER